MKLDIEAWIAVDSEGNYVVTSNEDDLDYSELNGLNRTICLKVTIDPPREQVYTVDVPDQTNEEIKLTIKEVD